MNKKYKETIEIDQNHMMKTIELSKLKLTDRKAKYEENNHVIWWNFYKKESLKYCLFSLSISVLFCLFSVCTNVADYGICSLNAAILSCVVFVDYVQADIHGMDELLLCTKLNPARIFVYKSNIYLFVCLGCTLFLNFVLASFYEIDFMMTLFVSLFPMYLLSGFLLIIIDKIQNKGGLILSYACVYVFILILMRKYIEQIKISNQFIFLLIILSFAIYCLGIYIHVKRMNEREGYYIWN